MSRDRTFDICVIGIAARFPGPNDLNEWWDSLTKGQVLTTTYDSKTLYSAGVPLDLINDPEYVPVRGHLPDSDRFDNVFFRVSEREAEIMDPQHRLMLETAWRSMEDAGGVGEKNHLITSVFASGSSSSYFRQMISNGPLDHDTLEQAIHGMEPDFIASLIAYKLGLTGPAVGIRTACSSSLVSLHLAVQSLLNGDCDQAIVVAAGLEFPQGGHLYSPGGIKSLKGKCKSFDRDADGVVEGSGVASIVLRRYEDCMHDKVEPYGVILGTAINNDGPDRAGYYAPSVSGQMKVIKSAFNNANIDISTIGYLETHGTGTPIGDPIEWTAASNAYKDLGATPNQIAIGALKANIGHIDAAAGLAALIKTIYVLKEGLIPPVANFEEANPYLEMHGAPLYIPKSCVKWKLSGPRRAAISAFGIGGTNAHVIIEQFSENINHKLTNESVKHHLIALSAMDAAALSRNKIAIAKHLLQKQPDAANVAYTLSHRSTFPHRLIVCGRTSTDIAQALNNNDICHKYTSMEDVKTIFMFPGQATQYPGMALPFMQTMPYFAENLDFCLNMFETDERIKIRQALLDPEFSQDELNQTYLAQPAIFILEYSIAKSLISLGVKPSAVIGHSLGEVTAACIAGLINLVDAVSFVTARGAAMQKCPKGAMLSVNVGIDEIINLIQQSGLKLDVAAINTEESCVVACDDQSIEKFIMFLNDRFIIKKLKSNRAFHTNLMSNAKPALQEALAKVSIKEATLPIALNLTGNVLDAGSTIKCDNFIDQAVNTVQFSSGLKRLRDQLPNAVALEIGVGKTLAAMATTLNIKSITFTGEKNKHQDLESMILSGIGSLWALGHPIDLASINNRGVLIHLPTYQFWGSRWLASEIAKGLNSDKSAEDMQTSNVVELESVYTNTATVLANIWSELLKPQKLDDHSNFFDLGGDSLLMTGLIRRVNKAFGIQAPARAMIGAKTFCDQLKIIDSLVVNLKNHKDERLLVIN